MTKETYTFGFDLSKGVDFTGVFTKPAESAFYANHEIASAEPLGLHTIMALAKTLAPKPDDIRKLVMKRPELLPAMLNMEKALYHHQPKAGFFGGRFGGIPVESSEYIPDGWVAVVQRDGKVRLFKFEENAK